MSSIELELVSTSTTSSTENAAVSRYYQGTLPTGEGLNVWLSSSEQARTITILASRNDQTVALGEVELEEIAHYAIGKPCEGLEWREVKVAILRSLLNQSSVGYCANF